MDSVNSQLVVMKFGGASLSSLDLFDQAADRIARRMEEFSQIIVVASAMGKMTDDLLGLAFQLNANPPKREQDMLLTAGERISISLMAIALAKRGVEAVSLTGSQSGIITNSDHSNAYIVDVRPTRLPTLLESGKVVVVAGFQGVSNQKEITTLGRGGSDTTAVALGVALRAHKIEFYKDVAGLFSDDPKKVSNAHLIPHLSYQEALALYEQNKASVIHPRAIRLAMQNHIPLHILSFQKESLHQMAKGSWIIESEFDRPHQLIYECDAEKMPNA
ncbi:MAG: aspartate kinase [Simkaniaceae bacterium]|nr:aspartate kinase [Simkaniaceae bacterium]MCF7852919.1 aspartate kinase [Simkaniaceae bacterium]